jgi:diguanylate cyclase (GGDEF)-like protein
LLQHLSGQIGISIDNALVYQNLETIVRERTIDIEIQKAKLAKKNTKLKNKNSTILTLNAQLQTENNERSKAEKELQLVNKQLHHLTITDALTQISNRRHFDHYLDQECSRLNRNSSFPLALLLCDIDYFKLYNDYYGHQIGDDCLVRVARVLAEVANRPSDLAARYGGEEFVLVVPQTDIAGVKLMAENIHQLLREDKMPHKTSKVSQQITLSIGIAITKPKQHYTPEQLIKVADNALYQVKENGRNGTVYVELK